MRPVVVSAYRLGTRPDSASRVSSPPAVLLAVLGGHGDRVQPGRGRRAVLRGGAEAADQGQAGTGQGQRVAAEGNEGRRQTRQAAGIGMGGHAML
ncbi:hypothetical protein G6F22_021690 [Rhizopus arrhizus]|nr:hypothetical protein G6F22_021690 [Rhizopus arrhizus]KAG1078299.1 hypothetical protein G6F40_016766 [Rhizopus arrhizus]KAG1606961.1 hypothetical protein G6F45_013868 [Rhizopus arrhizus]